MTTSRATPSTALPAVGRGLPTFTLRDTADVERRLWDYKQRRPVLLTVMRDTRAGLGREWLARLLAARRVLDERCAATLVIAPQPAERLRELQAALDLPFTLLADPDGDTTKRYLTSQPDGERLAIYLADRYLQCLGRWLVRSLADLPPLDDIAATLALADQDDCACGLPAWPEE